MDLNKAVFNLELSRRSSSFRPTIFSFNFQQDDPAVAVASAAAVDSSPEIQLAATNQFYEDQQQQLQDIILVSNDTNNNNNSIFNMSSEQDLMMMMNGTMDYVPYEERIETYLVPVLFAIIFIIGVLGNGALIFIFLKHRTMRNVPNMYICSLAIGDILVIFFCVPFTSTVYTVEAWPYGLVVCKFSEFIKDVSIGVSVFTLTALSADRYFAIVDPMRKSLGPKSTKMTCLTIFGIWISSIILALPSVFFSHVKVFNEGTERPFHVCYPFPEEFGDIYPKVMVLSKALVYYVVPLIFISGFYCEMAHHLVLSTKNMPGESQGQGRQIQARKKVAKMVLSFVVIFAMCFLLSHVFLLWFYFDPDSEENYNSFWHVIRILGFCLSFLNSCINPITLYCVSGTFRKYFNQYLFCCCVRQSTHHGRTTIKSTLCCPNIGGRGHPSRRHSFQNSTSYKSDGIGLNLFNSTVRRNNGLYRASTLTSTTSIRTRVTWDSPHNNHNHHNQLLSHRASNASSSPATQRLLGGGGSASSTPSHNNYEVSSSQQRLIMPSQNGTSPRHVTGVGSGVGIGSFNYQPKQQNQVLTRAECGSDDEFHLYENPTSKLLNSKDINIIESKFQEKVNSVGGGATTALYSPSNDKGFIITSFIDDDENNI